MTTDYERNLHAEINTELCRIPLPASSIGSICGLPFGHEGHHGEPIASTPAHPARYLVDRYGEKS